MKKALKIVGFYAGCAIAGCAFGHVLTLAAYAVWPSLVVLHPVVWFGFPIL